MHPTRTQVLKRPAMGPLLCVLARARIYREAVLTAVVVGVHVVKVSCVKARSA